MPSEKITKKYLRIRIAVALLLLLGASIATHQTTRIAQNNVLEKAVLASTIDQVLISMVESVIYLDAIGISSDIDRANSVRPKLRMSSEIFGIAVEKLEMEIEKGYSGNSSLAVFNNPTLDAIGLLKDFQFIAETIATSGGIWGIDANRYIESAHAISDQIIPIIRRLQILELESLELATARLTKWNNLALIFIVSILAGVLGFIFRPLEHRIVEAHQEIEKKHALAQAASAAKSNFLATMSHEIRTPMNGVLGMTDLLKNEKLGDSQSDMVAIIEESGRNLLAIIEDVLDFSKIEADKIELESRAFELRSITNHLYHIFLPQVEKKGLTLSLEIDERLAETHIGDGGRIQQIITNLVGNAIKFTNAGKITLRVKAEAICNDYQSCCVIVLDTGIGITEEQLGRIFTQFEQADNSTTRKFGGTGLGLAISSKLAQAMGGEITVESMPDVGTAFCFAANLKVQPKAQQPPKLAPERPVRLPIRQVLSVLVAEDNAVNQMVISAMLKRLDCEVTFAANGQEAVEKFKKSKPDMVFMDISMPIMDGYCATRAIRKIELTSHETKVPVIGLSAHLSADHREKCLEVGMDTLLHKPIILADVEQVVRKYTLEKIDA